MIAYLDGRRLQHALAAGARRVHERRALLDQINVFPVADHDTGTNLVLTLDALQGAVPRHTGECLHVMATRALDQAQGWAGSVFAWFLHGAARAAAGSARLHGSELAAVLQAGVESGRRGVVQARAGTIIDVLDVTAAAIREASTHGERDLARMLRRAIDAARGELALTPGRCPALRAAGVVDAGAQAWVLLLEGMLEAFAPGDRRVPRATRAERIGVPRDTAPPARIDAGPVLVVTDSGADLPDADFEQLGIQVVPLRLTLDGDPFLDKIEMPAREFYARTRDRAPVVKTSQPSPGDFLRAHGAAVDGARAVVSIHLPEALSGTINGAHVSARHVAPIAVHVVDSANVSVGQGLVVRYAAEAARAGLGVPDVVAALARIIPRTHTVAVVSDLSCAARGGRIGRRTQRVADALRLAPVLGSRGDGRIRPVGVLFGRGDLARRLARRILGTIDRTLAWRIGVAHCDNEAGGAQLLEMLANGLPALDHGFLVECGTALGAHAGPGALVVGLQAYVAPAVGRA